MSEIPSPQGPLSQVAGYVWQHTAADLPLDLGWQPLLLTLVLTIIIFVVRRGHGSRDASGAERQTKLLEFILPRDIYSHQSARVDVYLWVFEHLLSPLWVVGLLITVGPAVESSVIALLQAVFGDGPGLQSSTPWMLLYSLVSLLLYDFVFFLTHYTMHKVPALWALHRVHHSAEVLTPLTRHREHFLAAPIWAAGSALSYGTAAGIFAYLFASSITEATLLNISFFALLFGFNGNFRHFHVQFRYPRWLEKWLQSPAMHHVHHSYLEKHWDTNMAAVTSIWDRMFGTLYIPEVDEYTPWGLGPQEQGQHRSFMQNTLGPFRDWADRLRSLRSRESESSEP